MQHPTRIAGAQSRRRPAAGASWILPVTWLIAALTAPSAAVAQARAGSPTSAGIVDISSSSVTSKSKKAQTLAEKRTSVTSDAAKRQWRKQLARVVGRKPGRVISIHNNWTEEFLAIDPDRDLAEQLPQEEINRFLRCHFTNEPAEMDPRLFPALVAAARHFKTSRIDIVSGFRAPKYNLMLRKKGRQVARTSQHTLGNAVDFRLPGVSIRRLHRFVRGLRMGGVGFYRHSQFIHMDVGRRRYWRGR